jgi:hypothetical protein
MIESGDMRQPTRSGAFFGRRGSCRLALALLLAAPSSPAAAETALEATYTISIAGLTIGRADADSRFTETGYAAVIKGMTSGISRLVSDARATLVGSGQVKGSRVVPASYNLETSESGFETHVRMSMQAGTITDLLAIPRLSQAPDRVPLTGEHHRGIVDPVGAFLTVVDKPGLADGRSVCNRTLNVFDGWQRFDIGLAYKETRLVTGTGEAYDGRVVVCTARYVPVAGHREKREAVQFMAANKRLEVWYAPVGNMRYFVPYRILIGTKYGDLAISSTRFVVTDTPPKSAVAN